CQQFYSTPTF
nr:immunoglobulin light chain junction region [Macaca mulatta]